MTVDISVKDRLRYGTYTINGINGTVPIQAITSVNLQHAKDANVLDFDFGTNILEIIESEPQRLIDYPEYKKEEIIKIKQYIKDNPDKICLLAIKGIKSNFKISNSENEFLIKFQIECGFQLIKVFFRPNKKIKKNMDEFRKMIVAKKKTFVACIDEKFKPKIFESLYLECIDNKDDIVSFFGRKLNENTASNFTLLIARNGDKIIRLSSMIFKTNNNMTNSVSRYLLGFDCYSFLQKDLSNVKYYRLVALEGFYFNTLKKDTPLICVLTKENLFTSSDRFSKNKQSPYLPIHIHDIVRLNELFKTLHIKYTRKKLVVSFNESLT